MGSSLIVLSKRAVAGFWKRVLKTTGCWLFVGYIVKSGYGKVSGVLAHRRSWEIHFGAIPDGLWVLHKCDNPICVNPDHLFLGDRQDNVDDMHRKGRAHRGGSKNKDGNGPKLTPHQVGEIRRRYEIGDVTQTTLAKEYGVTQCMVGFIVRNESWKTAKEAA